MRGRVRRWRLAIRPCEMTYLPASVDVEVTRAGCKHCNPVFVSSIARQCSSSARHAGKYLGIRRSSQQWGDTWTPASPVNPNPSLRRCCKRASDRLSHHANDTVWIASFPRRIARPRHIKIVNFQPPRHIWDLLRGSDLFYYCDINECPLYRLACPPKILPRLSFLLDEYCASLDQFRAPTYGRFSTKGYPGQLHLNLCN